MARLLDYFLHVAVPSHSHIGAVADPLSVQVQVTPMILKKLRTMQRL
jgi:hypothetical protein